MSTSDDDDDVFSLDGGEDASPKSLVERIQIPEQYLPYVKPALAALLAVVIMVGPRTVLSYVLHFLLTIVGVTIGVALGLGLAMHVYEKLTAWDQAHHSSTTSSKKKPPLPTAKPFTSSTRSTSSNSALLADGTSYASLMASAGYVLDEQIVRGQVIKDDAPFWKTYYPFTDVPVDQQQAPLKMQQTWPTLPTPVNLQLGRFIEHIMRDYVSMWYSKMDPGIDFRPEREKREDGILRDGGGTSTDENEEKSAAAAADHTAQRRMVFTTFPHRKAPFVENVYGAMVMAFGNLAGRVEHLNFFSLALLKWTRVLAHTFRVYRTLRKHALDKKHGSQEQQQPNEMEVAREFLLSGKLHRAVTFGLDVPSLLFADANGQECGLGQKVNNNNVAADTKPPEELTDTDVLEHRLFATNVLKDCELDYNRVLSHRIVRALLPRQHFNSSAVSSLVVEIMGICVLSPLMNLFHPNYLNGWIIGGINASKKKKKENKEAADASDDAPSENKNAKEQAEDSTPKEEDKTTGDQNVVEKVLPEEVADLMEESLPTEAEETANVEPEPVATIDGTDNDGSTDDILNDVDEEPENIGLPPLSSGSIILTWASNHLAELDDFMKAEKSKKKGDVNFDDPTCQKIVVQLVLVVEAALLHGRCRWKGPPSTISEMGSTDSAGDISEDEEFESFVQLLMEMTSDIDAFEKKVDASRSSSTPQAPVDYSRLEAYEPDANEVSTLRTLISTWLHTGQIYRSIGCIIRAHRSLLSHFYHPQAFLAVPKNAVDFSKRIKVLDGVDIMVDTMAVLASPRLDYDLGETPAAAISASTRANGPLSAGRARLGRLASGFGAKKEESTSVPQSLSTSEMASYSTSSLPRFVDFSRNAAFASSLRAERERRMKSWESRKGAEEVTSVYRKGAKDEDITLHRELHKLAIDFHNGTHMMVVRDAARKTDSEEGDDSKVALLTVENVSNRRRIEVPDDDSSFLLKAQPRPLNPVSVHRDDHNHDLSYKAFLATYEEPAILPGTNRFTGGRYIRRCIFQFYPIDRTASISLHSDQRKRDKRKGKANYPEPPNPAESTGSFLSDDFLKNRHLCQKWYAKGTAPQSFLSSNVMELTDFNASPRNGKALDFIYRMSLFERPSADLAGKRFTIHDSTGRGPHRADASALEMSDASLSSLLLHIGKDWESILSPRKGEDGKPIKKSELQRRVELGPDGYPAIYMKFTTKQGDKSNVEIKPYRASFVRAALMVAAARQEAQLQSLVECVKAGSAKSATKARTEAQLKPTLKLLEYANDTSTDKARVTCLLRDLQLGVYHIDREQLRRNGLLNPRNPTLIRSLSAKVEKAFEATDVVGTLGGYYQPATIVFKIRCVALVVLGVEEESHDLEPYLLEDGTFASVYREEWVVYRAMKDFQELHKQLKQEVSDAVSSASTGARLVGAATAAFGTTGMGRKQRKALVPSLAQATRTGATGMTKKALEKRGELLDGYLQYLLSPDHLLKGCSELMQFLGAFYPFPSEVQVLKTPKNLVDPMGRVNLMRSVAERAAKVDNTEMREDQGTSDQDDQFGGIGQDDTDDGLDFESNTNLNEAILHKIDKVPLAEVRNRIVELIRYQFGFENASFLRSRMLQALETASFVAITKASNFRKLLYDLHCQHLSADSISNLVRIVLDILWPDGCWMTPKPPLSREEEQVLSDGCRVALQEIFPEQIRSILGPELTSDGLDMLHEMLQNRLVVKSMFYMLFDLVWIEVFPELRDFLTGASVLDIE